MATVLLFLSCVVLVSGHDEVQADRFRGVVLEPARREAGKATSVDFDLTSVDQAAAGPLLVDAAAADATTGADLTVINPSTLDPSAVDPTAVDPLVTAAAAADATGGTNPTVIDQVAEGSSAVDPTAADPLVSDAASPDATAGGDLTDQRVIKPLAAKPTSSEPTSAGISVKDNPFAVRTGVVDRTTSDSKWADFSSKDDPFTVHTGVVDRATSDPTATGFSFKDNSFVVHTGVVDPATSDPTARGFSFKDDSFAVRTGVVDPATSDPANFSFNDDSFVVRTGVDGGATIDPTNLPATDPKVVDTRATESQVLEPAKAGTTSANQVVSESTGPVRKTVIAWGTPDLELLDRLGKEPNVLKLQPSDPAVLKLRERFANTDGSMVDPLITSDLFTDGSLNVDQRATNAVDAAAVDSITEDPTAFNLPGSDPASVDSTGRGIAEFDLSATADLSGRDPTVVDPIVSEPQAAGTGAADLTTVDQTAAVDPKKQDLSADRTTPGDAVGIRLELLKILRGGGPAVVGPEGADPALGASTINDLLSGRQSSIVTGVDSIAVDPSTGGSASVGSIAGDTTAVDTTGQNLEIIEPAIVPISVPLTFEDPTTADRRRVDLTGTDPTIDTSAAGIDKLASDLLAADPTVLDSKAVDTTGQNVEVIEPAIVPISVPLTFEDPTTADRRRVDPTGTDPTIDTSAAGIDKLASDLLAADPTVLDSKAVDTTGQNVEVIEPAIVPISVPLTFEDPTTADRRRVDPTGTDPTIDTSAAGIDKLASDLLAADPTVLDSKAVDTTGQNVEVIEPAIVPISVPLTFEDPTMADSRLADPTKTDLAIDPSLTDPAGIDQSASDPTGKDKSVVDSTVTDPRAADPAPIEPTLADPTEADAKVVQPSFVDPISIDPTVDPFAVDLPAVDATGADPTIADWTVVDRADPTTVDTKAIDPLEVDSTSAETAKPPADRTVDQTPADPTAVDPGMVDPAALDPKVAAVDSTARDLIVGRPISIDPADYCPKFEFEETTGVVQFTSPDYPCIIRVFLDKKAKLKAEKEEEKMMKKIRGTDDFMAGRPGATDNVRLEDIEFLDTVTMERQCPPMTSRKETFRNRYVIVTIPGLCEIAVQKGYKVNGRRIKQTPTVIIERRLRKREIPRGLVVK